MFNTRATGNDDGNSEAAIRRKVQEEQKTLRRAFKHASDEGEPRLTAAIPVDNNPCCSCKLL